jgi:hypothetical protein
MVWDLVESRPKNSPSDPDRSQVTILTDLSRSQRPMGRFLMCHHKLQLTIFSETDVSLVRKDLCRCAGFGRHQLRQLVLGIPEQSEVWNRPRYAGRNMHRHSPSVRHHLRFETIDPMLPGEKPFRFFKRTGLSSSLLHRCTNNTPKLWIFGGCVLW